MCSSVVCHEFGVIPQAIILVNSTACETEFIAVSVMITTSRSMTRRIVRYVVGGVVTNGGGAF